MEFNLLNQTMLNWLMKLEFLLSQHLSTMKQEYQSCMTVSFSSHSLHHFVIKILQIFLGNLKNENRVLQWLIDQKSKNFP